MAKDDDGFCATLCLSGGVPCRSSWNCLGLTWRVLLVVSIRMDSATDVTSCDMPQGTILLQQTPLRRPGLLVQPFAAGDGDSSESVHGHIFLKRK